MSEATSVKSYKVRCENDPTNYHWQSSEPNIAAVIREFETGRQRRVTTINGNKRSMYLQD